MELTAQGYVLLTRKQGAPIDRRATDIADLEGTRLNRCGPRARCRSRDRVFSFMRASEYTAPRLVVGPMLANAHMSAVASK